MQELRNKKKKLKSKHKQLKLQDQIKNLIDQSIFSYCLGEELQERSDCFSYIDNVLIFWFR